MINAKVLVPFEDLVEGVTRDAGSTFSSDDERVTYLASIGLVEVGDVVSEKPKRRTKKKSEV